MKKALILAFSILFAVFSCGTKKDGESTAKVEATTQTVTNLDPKAFQEKSAEAIVLDVRTPEEVAAGKIAGAIAIDFYGSDFLAKAKELPKDREILVYCAVGARSAEAAEMLAKEGFAGVYHLGGGIRAWTAAGLPTVQE